MNGRHCHRCVAPGVGNCRIREVERLHRVRPDTRSIWVCCVSLRALIGIPGMLLVPGRGLAAHYASHQMFNNGQRGDSISLEDAERINRDGEGSNLWQVPDWLHCWPCAVFCAGVSVAFCGGYRRIFLALDHRLQQAYCSAVANLLSTVVIAALTPAPLRKRRQQQFALSSSSTLRSYAQCSSPRRCCSDSGSTCCFFVARRSALCAHFCSWRGNGSPISAFWYVPPT